MATFNLSLNTGEIDKSLSGSYNLLFNQYGHTGNLVLNGDSDFKSGVNVNNHLGVGANSYFTGDVNSFALNYFNSKSFLNDIDVTGNTYIEQITGGLRITGDLVHTGDSFLTGDLNIGGSLIINGETFSQTVLTESANSSTGDFAVTGNLLPQSSLFMSGDPSASIGTPLVSLTGYTPSRNVVEVIRGSLMVTGNNTDTGYIRSAYKSTDGSIGVSRVISIFDSNISQDHVLTFKNGILVNYSLS